jgi:acyl-CoA synthetase (NDP forming)
VSQLVERYQKPVALFIFTESVEMDYLRRHSNIPIFSAPENAMRAFYLSHTWASRRPIPMEPQTIEGLDVRRAEAIFKNARGQESLLLKDSIDLLQAYGFVVPDYRLASSPDEAVRAWRSLKGAVAMKINRPYVSHKTDLGAVRLDLNSGEEIRRAFKDLQAVAGDRDMEALIQSMTGKGLEVILGGKRDEVFGPVILFGLGGIFVEAMEDVVWRVAPINREEARRMIHQIKGQKIVSGIRGERPYDMNFIEQLLVRLSQLLVDFPMIQEIDINPVMVFEEGHGAQAVDARFILDKGIA